MLGKSLLLAVVQGLLECWLNVFRLRPRWLSLSSNSFPSNVVGHGSWHVGSRRIDSRRFSLAQAIYAPITLAHIRAPILHLEVAQGV